MQRLAQPQSDVDAENCSTIFIILHNRSRERILHSMHMIYLYAVGIWERILSIAQNRKLIALFYNDGVSISTMRSSSHRCYVFPGHSVVLNVVVPVVSIYRLSSYDGPEVFVGKRLRFRA